MLKNTLYLVLLIFLFGCEESLPPIDFNTANTGEWTYAVIGEADVPAAQEKTIVIEDLTGVRCSNCPKAAETAKNIKELYKERVAVIGVYPQEPKNLTTPYKDFPDLRTDNAQLVASNLFDFSNQLPGGGVNRRLFDGKTTLNVPFNSWLNASDEIKTETSLLNIELTKTEVSEREFTIRTDLTFTAKPIGNPFITILLLENNIAHPQTNTTGTDYDYVHQHVLREMYTPYNGSPIFSATTSLAPDRGVTAKKEWTITIPDHVNVAEASIVVFVNYNEATNKEILQCKEVKLK
jgi:hypothetical protein